MALKCKALTSKGSPCLCFARLDDPEQLCVYHSRLSAQGAQMKSEPLTIEEEIAGLTAEYRRLIRARKKSLETTRLILTLHEAIKELTKLAPSAGPEKKEDPAWMKKFRQS